jgi:DNA-binding SARP family transcriptional activator/Tfp pilus assembly protein PilF
MACHLDVSYPSNFEGIFLGAVHVRRYTPAMLELRTLGGLRVETGDGRAVPSQSHRKALALLAVLGASAPHGMSRDKLMGLLWPESDSEHASGALRQTLYSLKKHLRAQDLVIDATVLRLNPDRIQTDVARFRTLISLRNPADAVEEYGGPFLDGIFIPHVPEFERWVNAKRNELERLYVAALETLAREAEGTDDLPRLFSWLRKLQALDPCDAITTLRLMKTMEKAGDRSGALRHAQAYTSAIALERQTAPDVEVTAAVTRLRQMTETERVARKVASAAITPEVSTAPTGDAEAYELYLKGRFYWAQRTHSRLEQALGYFQRAVERDPEFALAFVAMADTYVNMSNFGYMPGSVALAHAEASAERAVMLNPHLAEAHASMGFVLASTGRLRDAEKSLRKSIDINPSYPPAHHFYTLLLTMTGRIGAADKENLIALQLSPLSLGATAHRGVLRLLKSDYVAAHEHFQKALSLSPGFVLALAYVGDIYAAQQRYDEALETLEHARRTGPRFPGVTPALSYAYARSGRTRKAKSLMSEMRAGATDDRSRINLGLAHGMNGDLDSAFSAFSGVRWDVPTRIALRASPLLAPLRRDPRYELVG